MELADALILVMTTGLVTITAQTTIPITPGQVEGQEGPAREGGRAQDPRAGREAPGRGVR
jgi:hypothetical protein